MKTLKFNLTVFAQVLAIVCNIIACVIIHKQKSEIVNIRNSKEYVEGIQNLCVVDSLNDELNVRDSIIESQRQLILTLTYQHEDDDALAEEERL